jgi:hypothetical protein
LELHDGVEGGEGGGEGFVGSRCRLFTEFALGFLMFVFMFFNPELMCGFVFLKFRDCTVWVVLSTTRTGVS